MKAVSFSAYRPTPAFAGKRVNSYEGAPQGPIQDSVRFGKSEAQAGKNNWVLGCCLAPVVGFVAAVLTAMFV